MKAPLHLLILADMVWPSLLLAIRLHSLWCILGSLIVEAECLRRFARFGKLKAITAAILMNVVSAFAGYYLLPLFGLRVEYFAEVTINRILNWGTFNVLSLLFTWLSAAVITSMIEILVVWLLFIEPFHKRWILTVFYANLFTVAMAMISLALFLVE